MIRLRNPETGETVHASHATAERLREDGYVDVGKDVDVPAEPESDVPDRPAKDASRQEWNDFAESIGLDPGEYSSKDDLILAVDVMFDDEGGDGNG